jgi:hypothetical protein
MMGPNTEEKPVITVSPQMAPFLREVEATPHGADNFEVLLRSEQPFEEFLASLRVALFPWSNDLNEDEEAYFELGGPAPSPWGHLLKIDNSTDFDRSLSWLVMLLVQAGAEGTLEPLRSPSRLWSDHDAYGNSPDQVVGTIDLIADISAGPGLSKIVTVTPERTQAVVAWLTRWCLTGPDKAISRRIGCSVGEYDVPDGFGAAEIEALLQRSTQSLHTYFGTGLHVVGPSSFRSAVLSPYRGSLAVTQGWSRAVQPGWPGGVADLTEALTALTPHAAQGRITRSRSPIDRHSGGTGAWPGRRGGVEWSSRDMRPGTDTGQISDVFGVMLLGPEQWARLPQLDPDRWDVRPFGESTLLVHREPELWFGETQPQSQELDRSRIELDPVLVPPTPG